jgi:hypothetical protein
MFVLGIAFAAFWIAAIVLGRRIEEAKKAHAAQQVSSAAPTTSRES